MLVFRTPNYYCIYNSQLLLTYFVYKVKPIVENTPAQKMNELWDDIATEWASNTFPIEDL